MKNNPKETKSGIVINNKSAKMLIVEVRRLKSHPLYKKQLILSKKYHVHCEDVAKYKLGEIVSIKQCRPFSKTINWEIITTQKGKKIV